MKWLKVHFYECALISMVLVLAIIMSFVSFNILKNFSSDDMNLFTKKGEIVFLLESQQTRQKLDSFDMGVRVYQDMLNQIEKRLQDMGYLVKRIDETGISDLKAGQSLLLLDALALSDKTVDDIKHFVAEGGGLLFNFHAGFSRPKGDFRGDRFIHELTGLKMDSKQSHLVKQAGLFMTLKLMSPINQYNRTGEKMDLILYEDIPLFDAPSHLEPDVLLSTWAGYSSPLFDHKPSPHELKRAGLVWHGSYGKGSWAYANFPAYVFYDLSNKKGSYRKLFKGMIDYTWQKVIVEKYPYLDSKAMIFVSEDTEYKYENLRQFSAAAKKYQYPVTAFCVASIAKQHDDLMSEVSKNPYLEIGSHSYSHKKIVGMPDDYIKQETIGSKQFLDQQSNVNVIGFRAPREEVSKKMLSDLESGGYQYLMDATKGVYYPALKDGLLRISRTGTDDYTYLINLNWSKEKILKNMLREQQFVNYLNGIFTLSTHTHLMNYKSNISILQDFMQETRQLPDVEIANGRTINKKTRQAYLMSVKVKTTLSGALLSITNDNEQMVKRFRFRIYWPKSKGIKKLTPELSSTKYSYINDEFGHYSDVTIENIKPKTEFNMLVKLDEY